MQHVRVHVHVVENVYLVYSTKRQKICIDPAFFSIDIQGFKGVNDTIDHVAGDGALHHYAALLSSVVKEASTEEM